MTGTFLGVLRQRIVPLLAVLGVVVAAQAGTLVQGCGKVDSGGGDAGINPAGPPIVIGASIGLTGGLAGNTRALEGGLKVAQQQINSLGGILGRQIQFNIQDDATDPMVATTTIQTLLKAGVHGVIGPGASSQVVAVQGTLAMAQVVELSASATSPALTAMQMSKQGWFFRTVPNDSLQGVAVAQFAIRGPSPDAGIGCRKIWVVHNDDSYGNNMAPVVESNFMMKGGTVLGDIKVPASNPEAGAFAAQVAMMIAQPPDCMAMIVFPPVGDELVHEMRNAIKADTSGHNWNSFFIIGTDGSYDPTFLTGGRTNPNDPSTSFVDGVYGTNPDSNPQTPEYSEFKSLYIAQIGLASDQTDLDAYTSNEYDAAILLCLAIQAAGLNNPAAIRDKMFDVSRGMTSNATAFSPSHVGDAINSLKRGQDINYDGASGPVDFDDSGDVISGYIIWQVQTGAFIVHDRIKASDLIP